MDDLKIESFYSSCINYCINYDKDSGVPMLDRQMSAQQGGASSPLSLLHPLPQAQLYRPGLDPLPATRLRDQFGLLRAAIPLRSKFEINE